MRTFSQWRGKREFHRPSFIQAGGERGAFQSALFSPFDHAHRSSVVCHNSITAPVALLFAWRGPANVTRLVMAVYVDAINRVTRAWTQAHMREEGLERRAPLLAYGDAAPAVSVIADVVRLVATPLQVLPRSVLWRAVMAVYQMSRAREFAPKASARLAGAATQLTARNRGDGAAIAATTPPVVSARCHSVWTNHEKPSKTLIGQFDAMIRHACSLPKLGA